MVQRDALLLELRPELPAVKVGTQITPIEKFQNLSLRPIIKLQHPIFIAVFKSYIKQRKNVFYTLSQANKVHYITNALSKDLKFKHLLQGIIIGHFTISEYQFYTQNTSAINKRIIGILTNRYIDSIQLFES